MEKIYLDANAAMPPIKAVQEKIREILGLYGNPSSFHSHGREMRTFLDEARLNIALALGVDQKEVIFTSGASEANRLFVDSLKLWSLGKKIKVVMSPLEHPSLLKPMLALKDNFYLDILNLGNNGKIKDISQVLEADIVIACEAHSETGIVQDINFIKSHMKKDAILMSDITQSFARMNSFKPIADIMSISAQKMGGFAGAGALILRNQASFLPAPWVGGSQEKGFRPGTEGALLISAFGQAA